MPKTQIFFLSFFISVLFQYAVSAQSTSLSPYSRYGIGDLTNPSLVQNFGMGGAGAAFATSYQVNLLNPALPSLLTKPIFDIGIKTSFLTIENATTSEKASSTSINHFVYAFPLTKKYSITAGLIPLSKVGYNIKDQAVVNDTVTADLEYIGSGGINKAFMGHSVQLYNRKDSTVFSIGANVNYLFGSLQKQRRAYFPSEYGYYNLRSLSSTYLHDFGFDLGAYYSFYPNKNKGRRVSFGVTYTLASALRAKQEFITQSFESGFGGTEFPKDTVAYGLDNNGKVQLPQSLVFAVAVAFNDKLTAAIDYNLQNWSTFSQNINNTELKDNLADASRFSVGFQYVPEQVQLYKSSIFKQIAYRAGFRTEKTYIQLRNTQLNSTSFTAGLSIPIRKANSLTKFNIGYEYQIRGTVDNNLLKETYNNLMIGFSFSPNNLDRWFYKRKYD